jgi:L-alanine-DL-glutamate epimerase-like enolase superfamily enzyme
MDALQKPAADSLTITALRAWRLLEPVGGRRYTVVRLETAGGIVGYGEGAPVDGTELTRAKPLVVGTIGSIRAVSQLTERPSRTLLSPFPLRQ